MFTLYRWYRIAFAPKRKPFQIGLLFTHKNGDFGAISVTERSWAFRSLKWRVTYRTGVHTIADSFSCHCHVSTKSHSVQCELGQWISAASSRHKLPRETTSLSGVRDSRFLHVYRKNLLHFSLRAFLNEWNAYIKTLGNLKKIDNTEKLYRQSCFWVFGVKEKDLGEGRAHVQRL